MPANEWVLTNTGITQPLLIQVVGCGLLLSRLATSSENQNVDEHSNLLAFALNTSQAPAVVAGLRASRGSTASLLYGKISKSASVNVSASRLQSDLASAYSSFAGGPASELSLAAPMYFLKSWPISLHEATPADFEVTTAHWDATYPIAVEWKRDATLLGTSSTLSFTPGKNEQGAKTFSLRVGKDDGGGGLEGTYPSNEFSSNITTLNDYPPVVPTTVLASAALSRNSTVYLQMTTGAFMADCATFSKIAVTENDPAPPPPTVFDTQNRLCTSALTQMVTYTLSNQTDGLKTLRVWTVDADGNISLAPEIIMMTLDSSAPALAFSAPAANAEFNATLAITGTCEAGFDVDIAGTGALAPQTVSCSAGGHFSATISPSPGQGNKTITATQTDGVGNVNSVSRDFTFDSLSPVLAYSTPTANTEAQTGVTITGTCETGLTVNLSGMGLNSPATTACTAGAFSQAIVFTAGEGVKNIIIGQTDNAGNASSANRDFIRDNTAPVLTVTSPSAGTAFQTHLTVNGTCEAGGSTITVSGDISAVTNPTCTAGAFSVSLTLTAGEGAKSILFAQNDSAGNTGFVSLNVVNDNMAPTLLILTPAANSEAQTGVTITGTCETGLTVNLSGGGLSSPATTTCSAGSFSQAITFTAIEGVKHIVVSQTDAAGNTSSTNRDFVRDNTAPSLAFTLPTANTEAQTGLTITGTCETGLTVNLSGGGLSSPATTACTAGAFSQAIVFTAGEGVKNIIIGQTDNAGNASSANRDFIKDSVAPALTIATPTANTPAQASVTLTGACETGLSIVYGGTGLLSGFSGACAGGTYSQTVFFSAGDGTKNITVSQTDQAGNATTVARDFLRDNVAPNLTQTSLSFPYYSKNNQVNFGGACESGLTVSVDLGATAEGSAACTAGAWTYTTASQTVDGTYNYTFKHTDAAGNQSSTLGRFIRDNVAPTLTFTSSSSQLTASNTVTFTGTCESGLPTAIAVGGGSDSTTTACSVGAWSYTTAAQTTDATRTYSFTQTDQAGNASTISATWERNTAVPNLLITSTSPIYNDDDTAHVDGNCESGLDITIKNGASVETTLACPGGTFSYDLATQTSDASRTYEFKQTNALSLSTVQYMTWIRDTTAPNFSAGAFNINSGAVTTSKAQVGISLQATDALSNITDFCLKTDDPADPVTGDPCWSSVEGDAGLTAAATLNLSGFAFNLPIVPDSYTVYGWVRDQVGNISSLNPVGTGTTSLDKKGITLALATPPTVDFAIIGSTDYPANPPSSGDLTAGVGSPIYIKWKASDDKALPATPISIYFTADDQTWTLVAANLVNGSNGSCQVNNALTPADDLATGCYRLSAAPTGGYLRFRVVAADSDGLQSAIVTQGMNVASTMRFLAGNTDPGTNLSAQAAMFFYIRMSDYLTRDLHTLAVDRTGVVYFKDKNRGILKVDPADGIQRVFLPLTGTSSGDGGPVANATAKLVVKMTLDQHKPNQRLWIYDYDAIRRVDLATGVITTVIGGPGATDNSDTVANPLNARVDWLAADWEYWQSWTPFTPLPNGDFYFQAGNDGYYGGDTKPSQAKLRIRYLEASTGQIKSYRIGSLTTARGQPTGDYNECQLRNISLAYNTSTSAITDRVGIFRIWPGWPTCNFADQATFESLDASGNSLASHPDSLIPGSTSWINDWSSLRTGLDGKIYAVMKAWNANGIYRFNGTGWTKIVGDVSGLSGYCADNTVATSCKTRAADVFVTENGTVYFLDDGLIRTITPANKIVTLMGQTQISGVNGPSLSARLSNFIRTFRMADDGRITFGAQVTQMLYEIDPAGNFYWIAGNGAPGAAAFGVDAKSTYLNLEYPNSTGDNFGMDPATGDIYHASGDWRIAKLTRDSSAIGSGGTWSHLLGSGANNWLTSDGLNDIGFTNDCTVGMDTVNYTFWTCWIIPQVLNYNNGKLITHLSNLAGRNSDSAQSPYNNMLKLYDVSSKVQTHLLGHTGHNTTTGNAWDGIGSDGTSAASADFWSADWSRMTMPYHISGDRWIFGRYADNNFKKIYDVTAGGNITSLATLPAGPKGIAYRLHGTDEYIYYCSVADNRLHRYHVQGTSDAALTWPISGMICQGSALYYRESTQSVIFSYQQNGLMGFAEYLDAMP